MWKMGRTVQITGTAHVEALSQSQERPKNKRVRVHAPACPFPKAPPEGGVCTCHCSPLLDTCTGGWSLFQNCAMICSKESAHFKCKSPRSGNLSYPQRFLFPSCILSTGSFSSFLHHLLPLT